MPDWTYQTVFRRTLMGLGPETGRRLAFGFMGTLARLPWGKNIIQFMGHMRPDDRLKVEHSGLTFPGRVGLGCALDPHLLATPAFAEFGLGFLEIGPLTINPQVNPGRILVDATNEFLRCQDPQATITPLVAAERLQHDGPFSIPIFARIAPASPEELQQILKRLPDSVNALVVPVESLKLLAGRATPSDLAESLRPVLLAVDPQSWRDSSLQDRVHALIREGQLVGVVVVSASENTGQTFGKPGFPRALETIGEMRQKLGPKPLLIGSVGVHSPADALDYLEAGADLVQVDSGLVFTGPGLPKRINEAVLYRQLTLDSPVSNPPERMGAQS